MTWHNGPSRRDIGLGAAALLLGSEFDVAGINIVEAALTSATLKAKAARKGLQFGTSALHAELSQDEAYAQLVAAQCSAITPGIEAKWAEIEPENGDFRFSKLDWMVDFARRHSMSVRGHNLVWNVYNPLWLDIALLSGRGQEALINHIKTVVERYRGKVEWWDVLNEPTDPLYHPQRDGLVNGIWHKHLGDGFVDVAFGTARQADPHAILFVNDDTLEYVEADREEKRNLYLRLIEKWLKRGVPIQGFGLEAHLDPTRKIAEKSYRRFLRELGNFGMTIHVTELDVMDKSFPSDLTTRDRAVAAYCKQYLDVVLDEAAVKSLTTWGLTDKYTYINADARTRRADGLRSRSLPYDEFLRPKPLWFAIADAIDHARDRGGGDRRLARLDHKF